MATNIFRFFKPGEPKEDRVQKRRGQLRQAQQTYRERKDRYIKSLEREISANRLNEKNLLHDLKRMQNTVHVLMDYIRQQGLDVPNDIPSLLEGKTASDIPPSLFSSFDERQLELRFPQEKPGTFDTAPQNPFGGSVMSDYANRELIPTDSSWRKATAAVDWRQNLDLETTNTDVGPGQSLYSQLGDLDLIVVGMEFVLTLERPCLVHLHEDLKNPDKPGGHSLTTSGKLLSVVPISTIEAKQGPELIREEIPAAMLDSLLALSSQLCADGEVTPVQAWNYIRSQPGFETLDVLRLRMLADSLGHAIKCHGFGAVIEQTAFETLVLRTLFIGSTP